jgi:hypothetical protein
LILFIFTYWFAGHNGDKHQANEQTGPAVFLHEQSSCFLLSWFAAIPG